MLVRALRHAARTLVHSTHTQHVHSCTAVRRAAHTRVHTPFIACAHSHTQRHTYVSAHTLSSFPREGWGLAGGGGRCMPHPPCNTRLGPQWSGTSRTGSWSSSAGSTSARRSWLWRVQPLSGTAPLPRHPGWSRHCPSVDQTRPLPSGQVSKVPLPSRQLPGHGGWLVGVRASGRGHHPRISRPSAGSLGRLPPRATVSQPQGRRQQAAGRPLLTHPPPAQDPHLPGARAPRPSLTTLDVEGAGVVQPVQFVAAARLGLPGVGEAGARGLHQPPGRPEVVAFEAIEVPAEA